MTPPEQFLSKMFLQMAGRNVCRTCLRKSSNMKLIDDSCILNLREICFVELSPEDKVLKMCIPCYHQLYRAAQFRKGCLATSRTLLKWAQMQYNSEQVDIEAFSKQPSPFSELTRSSLLSVQCLEKMQRFNGKRKFKIYTYSKTLRPNENSINIGKKNLLSDETQDPIIKKEALNIVYMPQNGGDSFKSNKCHRKAISNSNNDDQRSSNISISNDDDEAHKTGERRRKNLKSFDDDSHKTNERSRNTFNLNDDDSHKTKECRRNNLILNDDDSHKTNERKRNKSKDDAHETNEHGRNTFNLNDEDWHKTKERRWNNLILNDDDSHKTNECRRNKSNDEFAHNTNEKNQRNFNSDDEDFFKSDQSQGVNAHEFINIGEVKEENDDLSDFSHHEESGYDVKEKQVRMVRSKKKGLKRELLGEIETGGEDRGEINYDETDESDVEPLHAKVQRKNLKREKSQVAERAPAKRPRTRFEPSKVLVVRQTEEQQLQELAQMRLADKYLAAPYRCNACAKYFVSETSLQQHNQRHEESFGTHECPVCTLRYTSAVSLSRHRQTHVERYRCARCPAVFCAAKSALGHAAAHDGERPTFVCAHCGKISKSLGTHKRHEKLHTKERPYKCDRCPRDFTQSSARNYHIMRVHTKVHNYTCPSCPSTFVTPTALQAHSRRHSSERKHYCVECDLHFKSPSSLRSHLTLAVRHALPSALRFPCEHCDLRYTTRQRLLDHVHSNHERAFRHACTDCDKAYHTLGSLKKHRASRHAPGARQRVHRCGQCDKAFTTPTVLKIHLRTHSGEMPYSCPICSRTFRHTSSLWNHNKLVHKKGATDPSKG